MLAGLCAAGLPTDRFLFAGFPPPRPTARRAFLEGLKSVRATLILFEGPSRLAASLADMAGVLGPRAAVVARELTKLHETHYRGSLEALAADPGLAAPKGEMVIVIAPPETEAASEADAERALAEALLTARPGPGGRRGCARARPRPPRALSSRLVAERRPLSEARRLRGSAARVAGRRGEVVAALWLMAKGYRILAFRLRLRQGEIDLLAMRRGVLAAVEVKARASLEAALDAVTQAQRQRIRRALRAFVARRAALCDGRAPARLCSPSRPAVSRVIFATHGARTTIRERRLRAERLDDPRGG